MNSELNDNRLAMTGDELPEAAYEAIIEQLRLRRQFDLGAYKDR